MLFVKLNIKIFFFFFFQAEDGIRDYKVTGVQTCALPILAGEIGADEQALLPEADHGFRYAERAAEMRGADERLYEADAQPRAFDDAGPALLGAERRQSEVTRMLQCIRPAAAE